MLLCSRKQVPFEVVNVLFTKDCGDAVPAHVSRTSPVASPKPDLGASALARHPYASRCNYAQLDDEQIGQTRAWTLVNDSIFAPRALASPQRALYDTAFNSRRLWRMDWARCLSKRGFLRLAQQTDPRGDKAAALDALSAVMRRLHPKLCRSAPY